jgi:RNA polymerase sigma-70 factor (ECF subfamily)
MLLVQSTHWSVVLEAPGESPAAQEALEKLCRTYWRPIYVFVRRQGAGAEDAEDLTQGFFALLLERKDLNSVRKEKGRLRSYLLASVKHFLADESRRAMALKRGKGQRLIPFDDIREGERIDAEHCDRFTADQMYERRWAFTLLEQVMAIAYSLKSTGPEAAPAVGFKICAAVGDLTHNFSLSFVDSCQR